MQTIDTATSHWQNKGYINPTIQYHDQLQGFQYYQDFQEEK